MSGNTDRSSSPARAPPWAACSARSRTSPAPTSAASPSRPRWSAPASPEQVDYVIMGQVLQAGAGQIPARQAAVKGGIPMDVPRSRSTRCACPGIDAIALADQLIRAGEFDIVVAGGMESMTQAPHLLPKPRGGVKYGDSTLRRLDGPRRPVRRLRPDRDGRCHRGATTTRYGLTREEQDAFAARSHQLAAAAQKNGLFDDEIAPVSVPQRKGDPVVVRRRRGHPRRHHRRDAGRAAPAFAKDGTITAGSSSQISDGACAVVVMSKAKAEELGLTWLAEIGAHGVVAGPDNTLQSQPANAIVQGLRARGHRPERPRPGRAQRGVRRGRHRLGARARHRPRTR